MRRILLIVFLTIVAVTAGAATWSADRLQQPRSYSKNNFVSNPDGILSEDAVNQINVLLQDINQKTNAQVAVAVIENYEGTDIDSFASDLFGRWGVGEKGADNGVLLVVALQPHEYALRTGRGIGSVLADVTSARIVREHLVPDMDAENYDEAIINTVRAINEEMTTPEAVAEIKELSNRQKQKDEMDIWEILMFYAWCCVALTVILAIWVIFKVASTSKVERHLRYVLLHPMLRILYGLSFVGLGLPFFVYLPAKKFLQNLRDGRHVCPNCSALMYKLDEVKDNERLTPAQDAEERFNSVDYDVWECPNCGQEDIYAYENPDSTLVECPHCKAKTALQLHDRMLVPPTETREGVAVKEYQCLNCGQKSQKRYKIPKKPNSGGSAAAFAIPFILGSMGGRGGFGGGPQGGSFGGGTTGGGGTSGRW